MMLNGWFNVCMVLLLWTDVENVAPDGSDGCYDCNNSLLSDSSGGGRLLLQDNNNGTTTTTTTSQPQQQPQQPQQQAAATQPVAAVLSERPAAEQQPQPQSKTLPRAGNSAGQDFKRSSRTPRTQSDPSNMPNKADATIACTLQQMMMMPPARHSESASSLQKRSQSDLSQMGSTESGYSSLSLNVPSPSHSPTRLSSADFAAAVATTTTTTTVVTTTCPPAVSSPTVHHHHVHSPRHSTAASSDPAIQEEEDVPARRRRPVSRSCSVASSSEPQLPPPPPPTDAGTPSAIRRKSPEEIECEELSRDLISHLSPSDKLLNILGETAPNSRFKRIFETL